MQALIALVLLLSGVHGYTLPQDDGSMVLAMPSGRYALELGYGCDGMNVAQDVDVSAGSAGVATIAPVDVDVLCDVFVGAPVSDEPCAMDADGVCDIAYEGE